MFSTCEAWRTISIEECSPLYGGGQQGGWWQLKHHMQTCFATCQGRPCHLRSQCQGMQVRGHGWDPHQRRVTQGEARPVSAGVKPLPCHSAGDMDWQCWMSPSHGTLPLWVTRQQKGHLSPTAPLLPGLPWLRGQGQAQASVAWHLLQVWNFWDPVNLFS